MKSILTTLAAIVLLSASAPNASGQAAPIIVSDAALEIPELDLYVPLPDGIIAEAASPNSNVIARLRPSDRDSRADWTLSIQTSTLRDEVRTAPGEAPLRVIVDQTIEALRISFAEVISEMTNATLSESMGKVRLEVFDREDKLTIAGLPAARFYVRVPGPDGRDITRGYTILKPSQTRLVTFELASSPDAARRAKDTTETIIASARFGDTAKAVRDRGLKVTRGAVLLAAVTQDDWDSIINRNPERWERLYKPAPGGADADATELGYRAIKIERGRRGPDEGIWLRMKARLLEGGAIIDTSADFFVSNDRNYEQWTIRQTHRPERGVLGVTFRERGLRDGSRMRVFTESDGDAAKTIHPVIRGEGYVSRLEAQLMPLILQYTGAEGEFAFYAYRSTDERIRLRRDTLAYPGGRDDLARVTTIVAEGSAPQITTITPEGRFMRTVRTDGAVWQPTPLDRIVSIWKSKGLPLD